MPYILRVWNDYNQAYTIIRECNYYEALRRAKDCKKAFGQPVEIYERKEVI